MHFCKDYLSAFGAKDDNCDFAVGFSLGSLGENEDQNKMQLSTKRGDHS